MKTALFLFLILLTVKNIKAQECDTLSQQWETPTPTTVLYNFGGGRATGVPDPTNSINFDDPKTIFEGFVSPTPGSTPVGAVRVGLGLLTDANDNMTIDVNIYDGGGAPGAIVGGVSGISPTQLGVPGSGFSNFWITLPTGPIPTTSVFYIGVVIHPGDPTDQIVVQASANGQGDGDGSNSITTTGYGNEKFLTVYGIDIDLNLIPKLGLVEDPSFSYTAASYCPSAADPTPTVSGASGGIFSSTPSGLSLNSSTGEIDISSSTQNTYTVKYTTTGLCPQSSSQTIKIEDIIDPVINCIGDQNVNFNANCEYSLLNYTGLATATDNCGTPTITQSPAAGTTITSNQTVTLTATDNYGNTDQCTFNIIPTDNTDPVITCPVAITINTDSGQCTSTASIGTATATDNCTVSPTITNDAPASFPIGNTTVTWTATDDAGNFVNCTQLVTVVDNEDPTITCPTDITIDTDAGQCTSTASIGTATGTDNCGTPTITNDAPASFPIGNTTVTWTATDAVGNFVTCTQIVTVEDNENPTITCPADITIDTDAGQCTSTASIGTATGTDNCSVTITNDAPASFPIGNTTVTWTATDAAGNFVTCTQIVTVVDNENPAVTCPADITINTDAGQCTSTASIGTATGTDNCGTPLITNDAPTNFSIGNTTVTWTATDGAGNFVTCTQIVTVEDNENPTITCPTDITIDTDAGQCTSTASIGTGTGTDNCGTPTITNDAPASFPIGNTTVNWTSTDAAGNFVTCTQIVTVVDNEDPTITCPADITAYGDANCDFILTDYTALAVSTDNCTASPVITQSPASGSTINGSDNHTITLTATDAAGNTNTCSFNVTIIDTMIPIVSCLPNQFEILDMNCEFVLPDYGSMTNLSDNCDANINITQTPTPGTIYSGIQNFPVTIDFEDASGNSTSCSFIVDVKTNEINPGCLDDIIIATLLTPNGDGRNDTWIIRENDFIKDCTVQIFNRWGQKVYETTNYQNDWNGESKGQKLTDGAYVYVILCNDEIKYSGPLTILNSSN